MGEKVAEFWSRQDGKIICHLCPHGCIFSQEGDLGRCRVRQRHGNSLLATGYGEISSVAVDPIEKKPLYHFFPGHSILSVGSWGCNFACDHCQNWQISQHIDYQQQLSIAELKVLTKRMQNHDQKLCGVAFTYNEPLIGIEYLIEAAATIQELGMKTVVVSNGYVNSRPLAKLIPFLDAANIDVKAFNNDFYQTACNGSLKPVLATIEALTSSKTHVELTWLVIPGLNDSRDEIEKFCQWVTQVKRDIPVHFTAYHPSYLCQIPATPVTVLEQIMSWAKEIIPFVYLGNRGRANDSDITCPRCRQTLLTRYPLIQADGLDGNTCRYCGYQVEIFGLNK